MIKYNYLCLDCNNEHFVEQSIKDEPLKKCPNCKSKRFVRQIGNVKVIIKKGDHELKTVGHIAARNSEKLGKSYLEDKNPKNKPERPWWRDSDKPNKELLKLNPKQREKYIVEGDINSNDTSPI